MSRSDVTLKFTAGEAEQVLTLVLWNREEGSHVGTRKWWWIRADRIEAKIRQAFSPYLIGTNGGAPHD